MQTWSMESLNIITVEPRLSGHACLDTYPHNWICPNNENQYSIIVAHVQLNNIHVL